MARYDPVCFGKFCVRKTELTGCAFDGTDVVTCGSNGSVQVHRLTGKYCVKEYRSGKSRGTCVGASKEGVIFAGNESGEVWCSDGRKIVAHSMAVNTVSFASGRVATASNDRLAKVWDVESGSLIHTLKGHRGWVSSAAFSNDGCLLVTSSFDKYMRVWDTRTGDTVRMHGPQHSGITRAVFHRDQGLVGVALENGTFSMIDIGNGRVIQSYKAHHSPITSLQIHPSGNFAMTTSADMRVAFWDLLAGDLLTTVTAHNAAVTDGKWSHDGSTFATCDRSGVLLIFKTSFDKRTESQTHIDAVFNAPDRPRGFIPRPTLPGEPLPAPHIIESSLNKISGEIGVLHDFAHHLNTRSGKL